MVKKYKYVMFKSGCHSNDIFEVIFISTISIVINLLAKFKICFRDLAVAATPIIRLKTNTTVIDEAVGSQLFQNFAKFDF